MGSSPSISKLKKKEKAFDEWIEGLQKKLDAKETALKATQDTSITAFYNENHWSDSKIIASGSNTDFQHESDFTLKNLKAVIDAIGKAMFSDSAAPGGATVDPDEAKEAVKEAKSMGTEAADAANIELYIASKVFDILSGVITSFGATTKLSYTHTFKSESLGFGMQLFCTVAAESVQSKSFFNNEYIFEYLYIYEVRFSTLQAKSEGIRDLVKQYENAISAFEVRLNALDAEVAAGTLTGEQYEDQSAIWTSLISKNEKELQAMKAALYRK